MKKAQPADFPKFEAEMIEVWDKEKTFAASLKQRSSAPLFSFYDGPPFANGLPHYGHVVPVTIKDSITRYKTMRGYLVPRRNGWDTHGLPVEYEIERELGLKSKREIHKYGVDKFIEACRGSVFKYRQEWEQFFVRLGRWADSSDAYSTLDDDYMESVWWVINELNKKQLLEETFRSMPYCPRCATPLSNFEVNQNYKDNVPDPSVYVKFELADVPNTYLLAWTTTPWTLPANAALAVDAGADYVTVETHDKSRLILAKKRLEVLDLRKSEYKVVETRKGAKLVGQRYKSLYDFAEITAEEEGRAHRVYQDDSVSLDDGSGILHVAPRYGETDLELGMKEGLPLIESVDADGLMAKNMGQFAGTWFKDADDEIIADLTKKGSLFAAETFNHTYPFCWRCQSPLIYFAISTWVVKVTEITKQLVRNNKEIKWVPEHIGGGRFGNWLADARDWSISRNRFWGNPLPIWKCADGHVTVVGSIAELKEKAVDSKLVGDLHRPAIDKVKIHCGECKQEATRIEEVLDCWFESGSMPYAQHHYPFENEKLFKESYPADFIAEGLDQTRGWFYTLHVLAAALYDKPAFKNVIVNGLILAADGQKLSKRLKNYPPLEEVFTTTGADVLRFFMISSPAVNGEDVRFSKELLEDVQRNVFLRLWNVYSFFSTYAEIDGWKPPKKLAEPKSANVLDKWLVARLNQTIAETTKQADGYQIARAVRPLQALIDDLSNWYVRRSRRRFWKSEDDGDKKAAYETLHYALTRICQLLAPWSPFIADKMYRELTAGTDLPKSVHLTDWPEAGRNDKADKEVIAQMAGLREAVVIGLAQRAEAGVKVRQPLSQAVIKTPAKLSAGFTEIAADELNVKKITQQTAKTVSAKIDTKLTQELKQEGAARDIIRQIQNARKQAGLAVDDRIKLGLKSDSQEITNAIHTHSYLIAAETLAEEVLYEAFGDSVNVRLGGDEITISLQKAAS
ncbi:MAG TPA: isoleucine--tRNA ligase [Candidatus Dormibacteraeota bacterium]|nr:isoleucine--tRNA ligase [Candidatus Dormibacteraeota bacterium]